jgi:putative ABC transport system permease protein
MIVVVAFLDHLFAPKYPELQRDKILYVLRVQLMDTARRWTNNGPISYHFIKEYVSKMNTPDKIAFASLPNTTNAYSPNGTKLRLFYKWTDANFVEGKPYTQVNIDNQERVTVINENTRDEYFGKNVNAVGKDIELENVNYKVIGVVIGGPITRLYTSSDVYFPYFVAGKQRLEDNELTGSFVVFLRGRNKQDLQNIQAEFNAMVPKIPLIPNGDFKPNKIYVFADHYLTGFTRELFGTGSQSGLTFFYLAVLLFALLFMTLPALNLININMNRIQERASEIGIRKAFGASSKTLTYQFITENIILSLIGSVIAILLSVGVIYFINSSNLIAYSDLEINWKVLIWAILISIIFGLLSGVYPAWRMSKMQVVEALKQ